MTSNKRQNKAISYVQSASSHVASAPLLRESKDIIKKNAGIFAGLFCLLAILLIVGLWQLVAANGRSKADASSTPDVSNGVGIDSNVNNQAGATSDSTNGGIDVNVNKSGDNPPTVTVNGQNVDITASGSMHKSDGGAGNSSSVNVNISNDSDNSGGNSRVSSHSYTSTHSSSQTTNVNFRSTSSN